MDIDIELRKRIKEKLEKGNSEPFTDKSVIESLLSNADVLAHLAIGFGIPDTEQGDRVKKKVMARTLADIYLSIAVMAEKYGIDLNKAIINEFDRITEKLS